MENSIQEPEVHEGLKTYKLSVGLSGVSPQLVKIPLMVQAMSLDEAVSKVMQNISVVVDYDYDKPDTDGTISGTLSQDDADSE